MTEWEPGEPCPACGHPHVHAITRAGIKYTAQGDDDYTWEFEERLAIYEAFCADCSWRWDNTDAATPRDSVDSDAVSSR